ncbi:MAG: hypothetical protein A3I11_07770 [Elusimicrobia bacterium RIFCSPLOWO2_02_FULL_39_32]|nr:MAG: hypothetical protein A3B80_00930 [Elusimicrobia bacterium RIFCSPHIGHO2_02_FULL_39_36]OGR92083.1 MAG: hypothetical protein A3I11_07770 [Elusimicrobia bacterium RIFCSPLOWO2_02_FULL_39_32]OGR98628.1 MAG: hypothetical protein A3G85_04660 [Elusimicrobia bacterium RIFCSPLOWO2_12_FULL_39_28]
MKSFTYQLKQIIAVILIQSLLFTTVICPIAQAKSQGRIISSRGESSGINLEAYKFKIKSERDKLRRESKLAHGNGFFLAEAAKGIALNSPKLTSQESRALIEGYGKSLKDVREKEEIKDDGEMEWSNIIEMEKWERKKWSKRIRGLMKIRRMKGIKGMLETIFTDSLATVNGKGLGGVLHRYSKFSWYGKVAGIGILINLFGALAALADGNSNGEIFWLLKLESAMTALGISMEGTIFVLKGVGIILVLWIGIRGIKRLVPILSFIGKDLKSYMKKKIEKWKLAEESKDKRKIEEKSFYELTPQERREILNRSLYRLSHDPDVEVPEIYTLHGPSDHVKLNDLIKMLWRNNSQHDISSYDEIDFVARYGNRRDDLGDDFLESGQRAVDIQLRHDQDSEAGMDTLTVTLSKYMESYLERHGKQPEEFTDAERRAVEEFALLFENERGKNYKYIERKDIEVIAYEGKGLSWVEAEEPDSGLIRFDSYLSGFLLVYEEKSVLAIDRRLLDRLIEMSEEERKSLERLIATVVLTKMTIMGARRILRMESQEEFLNGVGESLSRLQYEWMKEGKLATWETIKKVYYDLRNKMWKGTYKEIAGDEGGEKSSTDLEEQRLQEEKNYSFDNAQEVVFSPGSRSWNILRSALRKHIRDYWKDDNILKKFPWRLIKNLEIALEEIARLEIKEKHKGGDSLPETTPVSFKNRMARARADIVLWYGRKTLEAYKSLAGKLMQSQDKGKELLDIIHEFRNVPGIKGVIESLNQNPEDKKIIAKLYRAYELQKSGYKVIAIDFKRLQLAVDIVAVREENNRKKFYFIEVKSNPENGFSMRNNLALARWLEHINESYHLRETRARENLHQFSAFRKEVLQLVIDSKIRVGGAVSPNGMIIIKAFSDEPSLNRSEFEIDEGRDLKEDESLLDGYFRLTPKQLEELRENLQKDLKMSLEELDEMYVKLGPREYGVTGISKEKDFLKFLGWRDHLVRKGILQRPQPNSIKDESQAKGEDPENGQRGIIAGVIVTGLIGLGSVLSQAGAGVALDLNSLAMGLVVGNGFIEFLTMASSAFVLSALYVNLKRFMDGHQTGSVMLEKDNFNRNMGKEDREENRVSESRLGMAVEVVARTLGETTLVRQMLSTLLWDVLSQNIRGASTKVVVNFVDLPSLIHTVKRYMEEKEEGKNLELVVVTDEAWMSRKELKRELGKAGIVFKGSQIKIISEKLEDGKFDLDKIFKNHRRYFNGSSVILLDGFGLWRWEGEIRDVLRIVLSVDGNELAEWVRKNIQGLSPEEVSQIERSRLFEKYSVLIEESRGDAEVLDIQQ